MAGGQDPGTTNLNDKTFFILKLLRVRGDTRRCTGNTKEVMETNNAALMKTDRINRPGLMRKWSDLSCVLAGNRWEWEWQAE